VPSGRNKRFSRKIGNLQRPIMGRRAFFVPILLAPARKWGSLVENAWAGGVDRLSLSA
jgi:hypothetical protein